MLVIFALKDRALLLPYFLKHYQNLGATRFICGLYDGRKNPLYPEVEAWTRKVNLEIRDGASHSDDWCGPHEAAGIDRIRATVSDPWHVIADLDEFYWLPAGTTLQDIVAKLEAGGYDAATAHLIDRIAADGSLVAPGETLDGTYPLATNLTGSVGACIDKAVIVKTTASLLSGHHGLREGTGLAWGECHHIKWLPGILEILEKRVPHLRRMGLPWSEEGRLICDKFVNGKLNFNDPSIKTWPAPLLGV